MGSSILSACQNQSKDDMLSPLMYLDGLAPVFAAQGMFGASCVGLICQQVKRK
jgi:hypothetical protein